MANKITVFNPKGGAGKSTSSKSIAGELAKRGYKVLLIDCDSSADTTRGVSHAGQPPVELAQLISDYCNPDIEMDEDIALDAICQTDFKNLDLMPATPDLMHKADKDMIHAEYNTDRVLEELIGPIENDYDFILYDTKEGEGQWLKNVLNFTDFLICPSEPTDDSINGFITVTKRLKFIRKDNRKIRLLGVFLTKYSNDRKDQDVLDIAQSMASDKFIPIVIRFSKTLESARIEKTPVCYFKGDSNPAIDYASLTDYILEAAGESAAVNPSQVVNFDIEKMTNYSLLFYPEKLINAVKAGKKAFKEVSSENRTERQLYEATLLRKGLKPEGDEAEEREDNEKWLSEHDASYQDMLFDISDNGINDPVLVTPLNNDGQYMIVDGKKRRDAALELGIKLPIKIVWAMDSEDENAAHLEETARLQFEKKTNQLNKQTAELKKKRKMINR